MTITPAALSEIYDLTNEAERLARGTQQERKRADIILARAAGIRSAGISSDEARKAIANEKAREVGAPVFDYGKEAAEQRRVEHVFKEFLRGVGEKELRQMTAGQQTISWTAGPAGGFLVPQTFADDVIYGLNKLTPLLDGNFVTLDVTNTGRPKPYPGIDLTQITGGIVQENTQQLPVNPPTMMNRMFGATSFKTSPILASFEFEQDSFTDTLKLLTNVFSVGLGRAMGPYLQNGTGPTGNPPQPSGLFAGISGNSPAVITQSPTAITANELLDIFHALDPLHRASESCAWVMPDATWKVIRKTAATLGSTDVSAWRFVLSEDEDELLGKPVLIDPNMSSGPSSPIIFGALEHFVVRLTDLRVRRNLETSYISSGQAFYNSLIRMDSGLIAPGLDRPVVYGQFSS